MEAQGQSFSSVGGESGSKKKSRHYREVARDAAHKGREATAVPHACVVGDAEISCTTQVGYEDFHEPYMWAFKSYAFQTNRARDKDKASTKHKNTCIFVARRDAVGYKLYRAEDYESTSSQRGQKCDATEKCICN